MLTCFACGRRLGATTHVVRTTDGQRVYVGPECLRHIRRAEPTPWSPPLGGPALVRMSAEEYRAFLRDVHGR